MRTKRFVIKMSGTSFFLTGFRTRWGVSKKNIASLGGFSKREKTVLHDYISAGKIKEDESSLFLEGDGFLFADGVAQDFFRTL